MQTRSTITNNLRFPGQYFDAETKTHYNFFRDYDPAVGRYRQADPIGLAGGINTYPYVGGNPVQHIDFFGLKKWDWNGNGDTTVCNYYDSMFKLYPKCAYYQAASEICKADRGFRSEIVKSAVTLAIIRAWSKNSTDDSEATILENLRRLLVEADKKARLNGEIDCVTDCVYGNAIDKYHNEAYRKLGLDPFYYGGNRWPQNLYPNPVPQDPRFPIATPSPFLR